MNRLTEHEIDKMYQDFLDEAYPDCKIAGYRYSTSRALAEIDPTTYRCGFADWLDSQIGETLWEHPYGGYCDEDPDLENEPKE